MGIVKVYLYIIVFVHLIQHCNKNIDSLFRCIILSLPYFGLHAGKKIYMQISPY